VGPDAIDNSILPSQLILLFFGEICPSSLYQKIEKNLDNRPPQKDINNNEWIGKKSVVVLCRSFHKNSRFFETVKKPEPGLQTTSNTRKVPSTYLPAALGKRLSLAWKPRVAIY